MNYPVWDLQSAGLIIAVVSSLHVFVSHFAVGGGLFLVLTEHKARRDHDAALLAYVKTHSRFFILLTLVFGAITGVGIWFSISLVHPAATSSLITTFVWGWAIEWTFFLAEIAAAMVYYYGWDRLSARQHLAVGWIYFANAYLSLVIINGILSYMLTPGRWLVTHEFWDGFFNPTYWPSLVARSAGAFGLAGLYALFTAAFLGDARLKARVAGYAVRRWVLPMAVALPISLAWYFSAAHSAGVPLEEIFNAKTGGFVDIVTASFAQAASQSGQPFSQRAVTVAVLAMVAALGGALYALVRRARFGRPAATFLMISGLLSIGAAEWVREGLRKPYVIGGFMFVNGVRVPGPADESLRPPAGFPEDAYTIDALNRTGVLAANAFVWFPSGYAPGQPRPAGAPEAHVDTEAALGAEVFRIECAACHSVDRYNAIRPLVAGKSSASIANMIPRLAEPPLLPASAADWPGAGPLVKSWRGRRMPPFVGTTDEVRWLSVYLAKLGGGEVSAAAAAPAEPSAGVQGARLFDENCSMCHEAGGEMAIEGLLKGRGADELYDILGHLPNLNKDMPPFDGTDEERRALAGYLAGLERAR